MRSEMGWATEDRVVVRDHDLVDLIGNIDLGAMAFLELTGRRPDPEEKRMFNAVLVTLVEHGVTLSVIAARSTYLGAPDAFQAAVAAGLLGAGSRLLGSTADVAEMLHDALSDGFERDIEAVAASVVRGIKEVGGKVPGFGHPIHRQEDPRATRLLDVSRETGTSGRACALIQAMLPVVEAAYERHLPLNATGVIGAIVVDLDLEPEAARGISLIARAAGLVGHLMEEIRWPLGEAIWNLVARYVEDPE